MNMKITEVPEYAQVNVVGKTVDTVAGTIDRKPIKRCLITEDAVDKRYSVVGGDGTEIKTVAKTDDVEVFVELVGGIKSLASYKFFTPWKAKNSENEDITDIYVTDTDKVERILATAERMCEAHPECDGQWKLVNSRGVRIAVRVVRTDLSDNGMVL